MTGTKPKAKAVVTMRIYRAATGKWEDEIQIGANPFQVIWRRVMKWIGRIK